MEEIRTNLSKENVCITCEYYEKCNNPEREIKCMGYKEKEKENE